MIFFVILKIVSLLRGHRVCCVLQLYLIELHIYRHIQKKKLIMDIEGVGKNVFQEQNKKNLKPFLFLLLLSECKE